MDQLYSPPESEALLASEGSANNQMNETYRWLEDNFVPRPSVSISRSTIYELYLKFCQQHNYVPVCKATFGKIIRKKFVQIKSKRLGARGQSKYHYYNISFRADRSRNDVFRSSCMLKSCSMLEINSTPLCYTVEPQHAQAISSVAMLTPSGPLAPMKLVEHRLSSFSSRELNNDESGYLSPELNENDYHAVIQSMLSYIKIPLDNQPLVNKKDVFINLYKIHCQCLLDSALSSNYVQHFWQQLPRHIPVDVPSLVSLDLYMFHLLESIYLPAICASVSHLSHLSTIAHLFPIWLEKTFAHLDDQWQLIGDGDSLSICDIKLEQALKWKYRIQCKVNLVALFAKLATKSLLPSLAFLSNLVAFMIDGNIKSAALYLDSHHAQVIQARQFVLNFSVGYAEESESFLQQWQALLHQFQVFLDEMSKTLNVKKNVVSSQALIDSMDAFVHGLQCLWPFQSITPTSVYSRITLHFTRLVDDLKMLMLINHNHSDESIDEEVDADEEEDEDGHDDHDHNLETIANTHLLLDTVHAYLIEICRFNSTRFDHNPQFNQS